MGWIKFNNISTNEKELDSNPSAKVIKGVVIQTPPIYEFPSKKIDTIQIQGKNGDFLLDQNSFSNVKREYNLATAFKEDDTFISKVRDIVDWLLSAKGYARLEDSYEPEYYRLACYRSGGQLPNLYDKATAIIIPFECKPQRFLKSGDNSIIFSNPDKPDEVFYEIENPTNYIAFPEITIIGGFVTIEMRNGDVDLPNNVTILTLNDQTIIEKITIDSDLNDVYTETTFINNKISASNSFPKLYPGKNWIKFKYTSLESSIISIKPRWWVL